MVSPPIKQVTPGAQLVVRYSSYCHHGIYAGGGRVIHYAGWIGGLDVVRRARSRLGERCYDLLENNCEHFCTWCQLGEARSVQIELMAKPVRMAIAALQALWRVASVSSSLGT
jgi:hypothetical protein